MTVGHSLSTNKVGHGLSVPLQYNSANKNRTFPLLAKLTTLLAQLELRRLLCGIFRIEANAVLILRFIISTSRDTSEFEKRFIPFSSMTSSLISTMSKLLRLRYVETSMLGWRLFFKPFARYCCWKQDLMELQTVASLISDHWPSIVTWNTKIDWSSCREQRLIIGLFFDKLFVRGIKNDFGFLCCGNRLE